MQGRVRSSSRLPVNQLTGPLSDTRAAAMLVDRFGPDVLERLPGRWVMFERGFTALHGDWHPWEGMWASNLGFESALPKPLPRIPCDPSPCLPLDFEDGGGTSDT